MFLPANRLYFKSKSIKQLMPKDQVSIDSGLGGTITLTVVSLTDDILTLKGGNQAPRWLKEVEYKWDEAIIELFLLMPFSDFGIRQTHIDIAKKAGYQTDDEIISIVTRTANAYASQVREFLKNH